MDQTQKESILKSIDTVLEDFFKSETVVEEVKTEAQPVEKVEEKQEVVEKSFDEVSDAKAGGTDIKLDANGGGDVIKNKDEKDKKMDKLKKEANSDEDEDEKKKKKEAKKSFEVSEVEYERLQKALSEDKAKADAEAAENDPMRKSVSALSEQIKELTEKVESLSKSPARQPKGLNGLQPLEKSTTAGGGEKKLMKSQVLPVLLDMQKSGVISSGIVCEYEASGNIYDSLVKSQVSNELTKRGLL